MSYANRLGLKTTWKSSDGYFLQIWLSARARPGSTPDANMRPSAVCDDRSTEMVWPALQCETLGFGTIPYPEMELMYENPAAMQRMIEATNAADSDAFVPSFTDDTYLEDWGRGFHGHKVRPVAKSCATALCHPTVVLAVRDVTPGCVPGLSRLPCRDRRSGPGRFHRGMRARPTNGSDCASNAPSRRAVGEWLSVEELPSWMIET